MILTGIHVYLGLHVLARGVVFVDLALAQVAGLGITIAFLAGHPIQSDAAYWYALAFTMTGAVLFSMSRLRRATVPQEAIIGIVYAVSAAAAVLVVDREPQGSEHVKQMLVGNILTVSGADVARLAVLYAAIGVMHVVFVKPLLEISLDPDGAAARGRRLPLWDFVFYASFGLVVTSSVRIAGVLLVFAYLIVPSTISALLTRSITARLVMGWSLGAIVSALGLMASYAWDLPTGATIVTAFGAALGVVAVVLAFGAIVRAVRARGVRALVPVGITVSVVGAAAGVMLLVFPLMDHPWLSWAESAWPSVETAFLTPMERQTYLDSREALERRQRELLRLRALQRDVQWGQRDMSEDMQARLKQFLAGSAEIAAGDRMVLRTLRAHARMRQRYWIGLPMLALGAGSALALRRVSRSSRPACDVGRCREDEHDRER